MYRDASLINKLLSAPARLPRKISVVPVLSACPALAALEAAFPTCNCNGLDKTQTHMDGGGPYLRYHPTPR